MIKPTSYRGIGAILIWKIALSQPIFDKLLMMDEQDVK